MLITIYCTILGLLIGSAINAIVWRLYVGRSWVKGRSMCPDCEHTLSGKDLIPVFSWLWLRGRCRYCRKRIHWQYPLVEVLTAALFGLSAFVMQPQGWLGGLHLGLWLVILTMLIILAVYDARWMILPDKIMFPAVIVGLVYALAIALPQQSWSALQGPILAAVLAGGAFFSIAAVSGGKAMGGGDIKLVFLMGLLLGLKGTALALLLAFNVAAIVGIGLILAHRKRRKDYIPFGPFLIGATIVAFLYGRPIVEWYLRVNGLY